jgi:hypothetical protein
MINILSKLHEAIGTGELISIIYHGGSEPGTARMILPIKIEGDKVRARCYTSNKVKAFSLEKIELAADDIPDYTGAHQEPASLKEAIAPYLNELKAAGWDIELTSDSAGLFTFFKNGKRRKTPDLGIYYQNPNENDGINHRPWYVSGHAYKYLSKAILKFMEIARRHKPF